MGIDKRRKIEEILARHPLSEGDLPAICLTHEGESITIKRGESGAPDVTYSVSCDGKDVSLHGDEVVVKEGDEFRFYKYDEAGGLARAERLFMADGGKVGEGRIDEIQRKADAALIESVRLMYPEALLRSDDFEFGPLRM